MKFTLKNKKTPLINSLINFFATLYDLVIVFFAFLYDVAYDFIIFLGEYVKWTLSISPSDSSDFNKHAKQTIPVQNQSTAEPRNTVDNRSEL